MIHLDTNFLIALEHPALPASDLLEAWLQAGEELRVSTLVWAEYLCGPLSDAKREAAEVIFPFKEAFIPEDAPLASRLFNGTGRRRGSMIDCMIAATALRCGASLATMNRSDFEVFRTFGLDLR